MNKPVAIVTGSAGGIGLAIARELARRGHDLCLIDRDSDGLRRCAADGSWGAATVHLEACDLSNLEAAERAVRNTAQRFGRIDVLVNNAAWRELLSMRTISPESWDRTLRVCLTAPAFLSRWSAEYMEKRGRGVIVNISSINARRVMGVAPAYVAAKGGLESLTAELAVLYGPKGIRVVAVAPGAIQTPLAQDYHSTDGTSITQQVQAVWTDSTPLRRLGRAEEIARLVAALCSDDASYISGTTIAADGGWFGNLTPYSSKQLQFPQEFS